MSDQKNENPDVLFEVTKGTAAGYVLFIFVCALTIGLTADVLIFTVFGIIVLPVFCGFIAYKIEQGVDKKGVIPSNPNPPECPKCSSDESIQFEKPEEKLKRADHIGTFCS